jgi:flagellin
MTSLVTNNSAMNALSALRSVNKGLQTTQDRISSGFKITSGKDNAAYFQISETMKGDAAAYNSVNEGLTMTKNSVATARLGAESFQDLAQEFVERVAFAQGATKGEGEIGNELNEIVKQMETTIIQSTFNGDDMVNAGLAVTGVTASAVDAATGTLTATAEVATTRNVVTGVSRGGASFSATTMTVQTQDLSAMLADFEGLATDFATNAQNVTTGKDFLAGALTSSESVLAKVTTAATNLGLAEKSIENQQEFLTKLVNNIDSGVGSMIDANMEEEAARLQALQVQQQLATQSLSIANSAPQNIMSLFR